jgi:hypothetical protein
MRPGLIRDGKNSVPGFGINIPDPQHWQKQSKNRFRYARTECFLQLIYVDANKLFLCSTDPY